MTETKNIYQRLAQVMSEVTYIQKEWKKDMKYSIVSHDAVTSKVRPALLKHGIVYHPVHCQHTHNGNRAECSMTVRFVNVENPDDFFDVPTFGYGIDTQDKGPGKAMSYAVKYALLKALGLETGDDAEMDSVEHSSKDPAKDAIADAVEEAAASIMKAKDIKDLQKQFGDLYRNHRAIADHPEVIAAKDVRKEQLTQNEGQ